MMDPKLLRFWDGETHNLPRHGPVHHRGDEAHWRCSGEGGYLGAVMCEQLGEGGLGGSRWCCWSGWVPFQWGLVEFGLVGLINQ